MYFRSASQGAGIKTEFVEMSVPSSPNILLGTSARI